MPSARPSTSVVATVVAFVAARAIDSRRRRSVASVTSAAPTPTSSASRRRSSDTGTSERLAGLALEPGLGHERAEPAAERAPDASAPGPSTRSANTGTAEQIGADRRDGCGEHAVIGTRAPDRNGSVRVAERSSRWVRRVADGAERAFLPAGERVDEIGEAVEVRHDLAVVEPPGPGRGHRFALGAPHDRARDVERGRDPVLAGQHELLRRFEPGGDVVDDRLERLDHLVGHPRDRGLELRAVLGSGRELRADDEQLALEAHQELVELGAPFRLELRARETEGATASSTAP